jgi:membrane associated rhomboid family serine protease
MCHHDLMDRQPPGATGSALEESEETYCYGHPNTPTRLRCSRCERPICGRCAIPASVGQHCPECVAEARRTAPKVRSAMAAQAPAVVAILAINIGFFILQQLVPGLTPRFALVPREIAEGEWWRLFTPMVLHSTRIFHILLNSLVLWIYGPHVERAFGTARFVALYVISGFVASVTSYAFGSVNIIGVGASGAIFGIAGVLLVYLYRRRSSAFVYAEMRNLVAFIGLNLVLGFVLPNIDYLAHLGGLLGGMALALGFDRGDQKSSPALELAAAALVIGAGVALLMYRTAELGGSLLT